MNEQEFELVKSYIKRRRYDKARKILLHNLADPRAPKLLNKIDEVESKQIRGSARPEQTTTESESSIWGLDLIKDIPKIAIQIILLNMAFWGILITGVTAAIALNKVINVILATSFIFTAILILYYLQWRFFWWFVAISWTIFTFSALCYFSYIIPTILYHLSPYS